MTKPCNDNTIPLEETFLVLGYATSSAFAHKVMIYFEATLGSMDNFCILTEQRHIILTEEKL